MLRAIVIFIRHYKLMRKNNCSRKVSYNNSAGMAKLYLAAHFSKDKI